MTANPVYRLARFANPALCFDLRRRPDTGCAARPLTLPNRPLWPISDMILLTVALSCSSGESCCPAESFIVGGLFWDPLFADGFRILQHCTFRDGIAARPAPTAHQPSPRWNQLAASQCVPASQSKIEWRSALAGMERSPCAMTPLVRPSDPRVELSLVR